MFSLLLHPDPHQVDFLTADLCDLPTLGLIEEEDGAIRAFFDSSRDARPLMDRFREYRPEFREEPPTDWERLSRDAWPPLRIGKKFFLVPPWSHEPTPEDCLRLEVYPGMACGTGRHPATQLCLEAIERYVQPGNRVLDVGSGSGILSDAAVLVGARLVVGCDIDFEAVEIARRRVHSPLFAGSIDAVRPGCADVIVANIDSATIERLAPEFARVRKPASTLILSGFPASDPPEGFHPMEILSREEWACWICEQ